MQGKVFLIIYFMRPTLFRSFCSAWDEIIDVFGDGHDYDWALVADDDQEMADETEKKLDMKYRDVSLLITWHSQDILHALFRYLSQRKLQPVS